MGLGGSLAAAHLEWGLGHAEESALSQRSFDLIVGSEIVYIPEYIPALAESIAYLLADDGTSARFREAVIVNTAVATRTTQSEARQLLSESLTKMGLDSAFEMPPKAPPPPNETHWADTSYIVRIWHRGSKATS
eukprot:s1903_g6.t1